MATMPGPTTHARPILLVPGMYQGGWAWAPVTARLEAAGHRVIAPDLAGLGPDDAPLGEAIGLGDHVGQVASIAAGLGEEVVACGHSYGGTVLLAAADRVPHAFAALVMLDANYPADGMSVLDRYGPALRDAILARAAGQGPGRVLPPPAPASLGLMDAADRALFARRMKPQPFGTLTEPVRLAGAWASVRRKVAVLATEGPRGPQREAFAAESRRLGFELAVMQGGHQLMNVQPDAVAALLMKLAAA